MGLTLRLTFCIESVVGRRNCKTCTHHKLFNAFTLVDSYSRMLPVARGMPPSRHAREISPWWSRRWRPSGLYAVFVRRARQRERRKLDPQDRSSPPDRSGARPDDFPFRFSNPTKDGQTVGRSVMVVHEDIKVGKKNVDRCQGDLSKIALRYSKFSLGENVIFCIVENKINNFQIYQG